MTVKNSREGVMGGFVGLGRVRLAACTGRLGSFLLFHVSVVVCLLERIGPGARLRLRFGWLGLFVTCAHFISPIWLWTIQKLRRRKKAACWLRRLSGSSVVRFQGLAIFTFTLFSSTVPPRALRPHNKG